MEEEKEKFEKELEFLKESFDSEVISEEEYLSGKERIEKQLNELKTKEQPEEKKDGQEPKKEEEIKKPKKTKEVEPEKEEIKPEEEKTEEIIEKEEIQKTISSSTEEKPETEEKIKQEEEIEEDTKKGLNWKFLVAGLLGVILIGIFIASFFNEKEANEEIVSEEIEDDYIEEPTIAEFIACSSDEECYEEGKIGTCINLGTEDAKCEFKDITKTKLTIVTTEDCFNCDTSRVLKLLKGLFPSLYLESLDYGSEEGKKLVDGLKIDALPTYIFDENLDNTFNFEKIKGAFEEINGRFVMNKEASGANYFLNRGIISNRLDVFLIEGEISTVKTEQSLEEFLELFGDNINLFKHNKEDSLTRELEIKTFPTFLINNKIKFSGVQSANKIKENFCQLNNLEGCSEELSKSLI